MATWAGSTAYPPTEAVPTLDLASSNNVEMTSMTSLRTSAFNFASNIRLPQKTADNPMTRNKGSQRRRFGRRRQNSRHV